MRHFYLLWPFLIGFSYAVKAPSSRKDFYKMRTRGERVRRRPVQEGELADLSEAGLDMIKELGSGNYPAYGAVGKFEKPRHQPTSGAQLSPSHFPAPLRPSALGTPLSPSPFQPALPLPSANAHLTPNAHLHKLSAFPTNAGNGYLQSGGNPLYALGKNTNYLSVAVQAAELQRQFGQKVAASKPKEVPQAYYPGMELDGLQALQNAQFPQSGQPFPTQSQGLAPLGQVGPAFPQHPHPALPAPNPAPYLPTQGLQSVPGAQPFPSPVSPHRVVAAPAPLLPSPAPGGPFAVPGPVPQPQFPAPIPNPGVGVGGHVPSFPTGAVPNYSQLPYSPQQVNVQPFPAGPRPASASARQPSGKRLEIGSFSGDTVMDALLKQVRGLHAVSYSRRDCARCRVVEDLLEKQYRLPTNTFFLDALEKGPELLRFIGDITGSTDVPKVFVCGYYIGGYQEVLSSHRNGELGKYVRKCFNGN